METYDDNLYLSNTDEISDYLTTATPSLSLNVTSQDTQVECEYAPAFVWYDKEDQNDTVRHFGTATVGRDLTEYLRLDLVDTYIQSEEPIEEAEDVEGVRDTRESYRRNVFRGSLGYLFGPEDALTMGYRHSLLKNDDDAVDNGRVRNPFASVIYWFNVKNGLEIDYQYTKAVFWRGDDLQAGDDYTGNGAGMRYVHRFTPHATGSLSYRYTDRDFEGDTEDYMVHEGLIRYDQAFSPDLSVSLGCGGFVQELDQSDSESGINYDLALAKRFERGNLTISGSGGWDEAYLEAERRGFTRYRRISMRLDYRITGFLGLYAGWSGRLDEDDADHEWATWGRHLGLKWKFLKRFSLAFNYSYAERDDDVDTEDYTVNRFAIMLSAGELYRW
jgi:hypothetical protein